MSCTTFPRPSASENEVRRKPIGTSVLFSPRSIVPIVLVAARLGCGGPDSERRLPVSTSNPGRAVSREAAAALEPPPFSDVTGEVGLDFVHINGMSGQRYIVEMMGSGRRLSRLRRGW